MLQEETYKSENTYQWLESNESRRKITDRQIIESTLALNQSCLSHEEQDIYALLVKYREAYSPRDETGTCLNIKVKFTNY